MSPQMGHRATVLLCHMLYDQFKSMQHLNNLLCNIQTCLHSLAFLHYCSVSIVSTILNHSRCRSCRRDNDTDGTIQPSTVHTVKIIQFQRRNELLSIFIFRLNFSPSIFVFLNKVKDKKSTHLT